MFHNTKTASTMSDQPPSYSQATVPRSTAYHIRYSHRKSLEHDTDGTTYLSSTTLHTYDDAILLSPTSTWPSVHAHLCARISVLCPAAQQHLNGEDPTISLALLYTTSHSPEPEYVDLREGNDAAFFGLLARTDILVTILQVGFVLPERKRSRAGICKTGARTAPRVQRTNDAVKVAETDGQGCSRDETPPRDLYTRTLVGPSDAIERLWEHEERVRREVRRAEREAERPRQEKARGEACLVQ